MPIAAQEFPSGASWQGLRGVSWLQSLSDEKLAVLATQCRWHRLEPGQMLHGPYTDRRMYVLVGGLLSLGSYSASGRAMIFGHVEPGFFFGAFAPPQPPQRVSVQVHAMQASLVASLSNEELEALIMSEILVMRAVVQHLSELTGVLARRVVSLGTLSVRGRLHAQLLEQAERAGIEGEQALLSPAPRQNDLALMLGTSREEVAREMSRLTRLGLLRREGRNLRICHVDGLRVLLEEAR
ncbi:Crp/Fnr family transcriptional regulator [Comamonas guangdongensis]|uniref:Crp/Fnr family transcriptional regulator n=1 Tax=Comamonas guangdongensis TaxID=510515 RepID=A0ABV3ZPJ3_9BURK